MHNLDIDRRLRAQLPALTTTADMHPPSDLITDESYEESPTSMVHVHVGAPPPPPPPPIPQPQLVGLPPPAPTTYRRQHVTDFEKDNS